MELALSAGRRQPSRLTLATPAALTECLPSVSRMKAQCRNRAHQILRTRLPNIDTKYEGRRVDGTYAVNGTAYVRRRRETFQCSFDRTGRRIIRFIVN